MEQNTHNPIPKNFNKDVEKLLKEGIDGNGFICAKVSIEELLNLLIENYLDECNNFYNKKE